MFASIARLISILADLLVLVIIINSLVSFFLSPYHSVRMALDRILEPFYTPIRRIVPPAGMFDFTPLILIIIIQILSYLLTAFLYSI